MKTTIADFKKSLLRVRRIADAGKADRALAALDEMLAGWPDHPVLLLEQSRLIQLSEHGRLGLAKQSLKQAARVNEASPEPWIELGYYILCVEDRAKDAEADFDRAIQLGLRLLAEAVAGKMEAIVDQFPDRLPAEKLAEAASLLHLAEFLGQRVDKSLPPEIGKLRKQAEQLGRLTHPVRKHERNGG